MSVRNLTLLVWDVYCAQVMAAGDAKSSPTTPPPAKWTVPEVVVWIRSLNPQFGGYALAFERDSVDGEMLIHDITPSWLEQHVPNALHRSRISREISALKQRATETDGTNSVMQTVPPTVTTIGAIGAVGPNAKSIRYTTNQYFNSDPAASVKVEAYDFSSLIESKLSDIKRESFGREWLYERMYDWLIPPPLAVSTVQSRVLLISGEPVGFDACFSLAICSVLIPAAGL